MEKYKLRESKTFKSSHYVIRITSLILGIVAVMQTRVQSQVNQRVGK